MTISMVRGYSNPPSSGGAAYHGFGEMPAQLGSQFGYTYVTQEGEGWSEPEEGAFHPVEHWDEFPPEQPHPSLMFRRPPGLLVPGPFGAACCQSCASAAQPMGAYFSDDPVAATGSSIAAVASVAALLYLVFGGKKKRKPARTFRRKVRR